MSGQCRICLKLIDELSSIYICKDKKYLPHVIYNISGVKISRRLEPTAQICKRCTTALLIAQRIILRCQESEELLAFQRLLETCSTEPQKAYVDDDECKAETQNISDDFPATPIEICESSIEMKVIYSDNECAEEQPPSAKTVNASNKSAKILPSIRLNRNRKKFQCDHCEYSNDIGRRLVEHKANIHNIYDANIYACDLCTQRFSWKPTLYRHIQLVHKTLPADKKYVCNDCQRAYTRTEHLAEHQKQRHGPRSFECPDPFCEQTFTRAFTLRRHYTSAHTDPDKARFHCVDCDKYFKIYDLWKYHNEVVHKNDIVYCPHCGYAFRFKEKLNEHLLKDACKGSVVPCNYCQRRFTTKTGLKDHMRNLHKFD